MSDLIDALDDIPGRVEARYRSPLVVVDEEASLFRDARSKLHREVGPNDGAKGGVHGVEASEIASNSKVDRVARQHIFRHAAAQDVDAKAAQLLALRVRQVKVIRLRGDRERASVVAQEPGLAKQPLTLADYHDATISHLETITNRAIPQEAGSNGRGMILVGHERTFVDYPSGE